MNPNTLSPEAQVIVLLCSRVALPPADLATAKQLSAREWSEVSEKLAAAGFQPSDLLERPADEVLCGLQLEPALTDRITKLMMRGGQLAIELDHIAQRGIWVLTRADRAYPEKWKTRLQARAPAVLFGAGDVDLLSRSAVAVVGSRDVDDAARDFASRLAELCAAAGVGIVSGAARGIDQAAMTAALEHSGHAVGVLADDLERILRNADTRDSVAAGRLTLVTPFHYSAPFSVGNAMGRNRLIYSLSDYAVVVAASEETGGTWAGATENLKESWVPLFVRDGEHVPPGNTLLRKAGALPLADADLTPELLDLLRARTSEIAPRNSRGEAQASFAWDHSRT